MGRRLIAVRAWNDLVDGLVYGGDYNPEQWPAEVWEEDIALMQEAGVNLVSLAIFSWATIEPNEGEFHWERLDTIIEKLHAGGIRIALATATASPPPWLTHRHPEMLPQHADGTVLHQGGRQSYAPTSPVYLRYATQMATRMAQRYASHPAVALWHIDNEIGCHVPEDFSDNAVPAFRAWLAERYGTVEALNQAWGTAFWSQRYGTFDDVLPPRTAPTYANPTQQLDFKRFSSDAGLAYFQALRQAVLAVNPDVPVTTNFMCNTGNRGMDYFGWADAVDVVANDHYTRAHDEERHIELAFSADLTRGVAHGAPWLLMEHSTSAVNWQYVNRAKGAGEMLRDSLDHVARGADGAMFFQWRASRAGAEKFHSGMVPHAGTDTQLWRTTVELGRCLRALAPVRGTRVVSRAALVFDYHAWWALELDSHPNNTLAYADLVLEWYKALWYEGIGVDVVTPDADLTGYDLVLAPNLYLADTAAADNIAGVVRRGGVFATTWFSGIVDAADHVHLGGYPGAFRDLLGVRVEEFNPLQVGQSVGVRLGDVDTVGVRWSEDVQLRGAQERGVITDGPLAGAAVVTEREVGEGRAWYVATDLPLDAKRSLVRTWADQAGVAPVQPGLPAGVEAVRRVGDGVGYLFLLNHTDRAARLTASGTDLLTGTAHAEPWELPAGAVAVLREDTAA